MTLLIVADDLTGAADSAARCHHAGLPATIYLQPPPPPWPPGALAFSTDSRFLAPAEAAARVKELLAALKGAGVVWYKKIDSTLRGNLGAELDAMLAELTPGAAAPVAVICPAFPAQGRGLEQGDLMFAQADGQRRHLPALLSDQTTRPVALLTLEIVRRGAVALARAMQELIAQGAQLLVVDGMTDQELTTILTAAQLAHPQPLLCGSAGLMTPLARQLAAQAPRALTSAPSIRLDPPLLGVVGSGSAMAHRQLARLRGATGITIATLAQAEAAIAAGEDFPVPQQAMLIHLPAPAPAAVLEGDGARRLAARLADAAVQLVKRLAPRSLLLVGGDTTVAVLARLGIAKLAVVNELMPGIPLLLGEDSAGQGWPIITKAGNFGDEATLQQLVQFGST